MYTIRGVPYIGTFKVTDLIPIRCIASTTTTTTTTTIIIIIIIIIIKYLRYKTPVRT
jgi:hypothetical protein